MASRRQYLSQTELAQYADITIVDATEADDQISQAEELIDAYVGFQDKFLSNNYANVIEGLAQSGSTTTLKLELRHQGVFQTDFFTYCEVEIIGGSAQGQRTIIQSSTYASGTLTFRDALTTAIDSTSFYRIYQLGKFPRIKDAFLDAINPTTPRYYKNIPEMVKRATAAQVEYMISQGSKFFSSNDVFINAEAIGDYRYDKTRDGSGTGIQQLIAPKAKQYLQGYTNRKGVVLT